MNLNSQHTSLTQVLLVLIKKIFAKPVLLTTLPPLRSNHHYLWQHSDHRHVDDFALAKEHCALRTLKSTQSYSLPATRANSRDDSNILLMRELNIKTEAPRSFWLYLEVKALLAKPLSHNLHCRQRSNPNYFFIDGKISSSYFAGFTPFSSQL